MLGFFSLITVAERMSLGKSAIHLPDLILLNPSLIPPLSPIPGLITSTTLPRTSEPDGKHCPLIVKGSIVLATNTSPIKLVLAVTMSCI